ncbi:MAG: sulfotransferase [Bacteroidota bacterium]
MQPIFIGGCQRSGTTLLASMLASVQHHVAVPESPFKFDLWAREARSGGDLRLSTIRNALDASLRFRIWGVDLDDVQFGREDWMSSIVRAYARDHGVVEPVRWVDHTPENIRYAHVLRDRYPDCQIVHIVRDGRAAMNSVFALNWGPDDPVTASRWWSQSVGAGLAAEKTGAHRVHYEDLILRPAETLERLCDALGMTYIPGMEGGRGFDLPAYTAEQHKRVGSSLDASRITSWKSSLSRREIEIFESRTGGLLPLLGYEPEFGLAAVPPTNVELFRFAVKARGNHLLNRVRQKSRLRRAASRPSPSALKAPSRDPAPPASVAARTERQSVGTARRQTLTACTIAKDEERDLPGWIENTLRFCDEVAVVVDATTTDETREVLAEAIETYGDRVRWTERGIDAHSGFSGQRNASLDLATSDWALHMDVDMRVTPELAQSIRSSIEGTEKNGFRFRLLNYFLHHPIKGGGWSRWNKEWLGRTGAHRFANVIHEVAVIDGGEEATGQLEGLMWHLNDVDYVERLSKNVQYMQESGRNILERGIRVRWFHMWLYPSYRAIKTYLFQGGWRDGSLGYLHAMMTFATIFNWWGYAWDVQNRVEREDLEASLDTMWQASAQPDLRRLPAASAQEPVAEEEARAI